MRNARVASLVHLAPAVSFVNAGARNLPMSGGATATLSGLAFATYDATPTGTVGGADCQTASWTTGTTVSCLTASGSTSMAKATVTVAGVAGTLNGYFTFDGASAVL